MSKIPFKVGDYVIWNYPSFKPEVLLINNISLSGKIEFSYIVSDTMDLGQKDWMVIQYASTFPSHFQVISKEEALGYCL